MPERSFDPHRLLRRDNVLPEALLHVSLRELTEHHVENCRASHIFLCPSVKAEDGDEEGIPNSLKEAMAVGLPVVATFHSGIPELVEDGVSGFLVQERNDSTLADKIKALVDSPETRIEMGRQGRRKIEDDG